VFAELVLGMGRAGMASSLSERFERQVDRSGDHHVWLGATNADRGTGQLKVQGRNTTVHRVAWEIAHGLIAPGTRVRASLRRGAATASPSTPTGPSHPMPGGTVQHERLEQPVIVVVGASTMTGIGLAASLLPGGRGAEVVAPGRARRVLDTLVGEASPSSVVSHTHR